MGPVRGCGHGCWDEGVRERIRESGESFTWLLMPCASDRKVTEEESEPISGGRRHGEEEWR